MRVSHITRVVSILGLTTVTTPNASAQWSNDWLPAPPKTCEGEFEHKEVPCDPPIAPADLGPRVLSPPAVVVRGPFESVQVNVDTAGNNIRYDAANEPSIAVNPNNPDNIVIGWRQFDSYMSDFRQAGYAYSDDGGRTWNFPGVVQPGVFRSDPVLAADRNGVFYYYSLNDRLRCQLFRSFDGGLTWSDRIFALGGDKPWMVVDNTTSIGYGHIYAAWEFSATRAVPGGQTFDEERSARARRGHLTVGPEGQLYLVHGVDSTVSSSLSARDRGARFEIEVVGQANLGGQAGRIGGPNGTGLLGQPWISANHTSGPNRGHLYLLQSILPPGDDPLDVMFVRSTDGGANWSVPVRVNDDPVDSNAWQWFGTMSVAPATGRIDAIWNDTRNSPNDHDLAEIFYAYSTDEGRTWSRNMPVTPAFDSSLSRPWGSGKLGDYYHMISDESSAMLAYAATFNGEQDVYFIRIAPDCNGNGFHDGEDIASGRSLDDNGDGRPDECEFLQCDQIKRFKVVCRGARIVVRVKAKSPTVLPGLTIDNNGDTRTLTFSEEGFGKLKWRKQHGLHTVRVAECPERVKLLDCGYDRPANDKCKDATELVTDHVTVGSTYDATGEDQTSCGPGDVLDVWYRWEVPCVMLQSELDNRSVWDKPLGTPEGDLIDGKATANFQRAGEDGHPA